MYRGTLIILFLIAFSSLAGYAQTYTSKDNFTGEWGDSSTWDPEWSEPLYNISGVSINIYGKITSRDSISFSGSANSLTIYDTLIINGSLTLSNNSSLVVSDNAVLLIIGNLRMENQSNITANGLIVVSGDIIKNSALNQGFFISNDDPVKVFIFGSVYPSEIIDDLANYGVLNCISPSTTVYPNSSCSYGDYLDFLSSPYTILFDQSVAETNKSYIYILCVGDTLRLESATAKEYLWSGPGNFTSNEKNLVFPNADKILSGDYIINVTTIGYFTDTDTISVNILDYPIVNPGMDQTLPFVFEARMEAELGNNETGVWTILSGSGIIADSTSPNTIVNDLSLGENRLLWTVSNGACESSAELIIIVEALFVPTVITPNGDGINDYFAIDEVSLEAELIIFNRWGVVEYTHKEYKNEWNGINSKGHDLPGDTYFYVLKFANNVTLSGSILIQR